jgi:hypothetical protein
MTGATDWDGKHIFKTKEKRVPEEVTDPDAEKLRNEVEPWLTALFQSEHLSLVLGAGLSSAVHILARGTLGAGMGEMEFSAFQEKIQAAAQKSAENSGRGEPNIEDQIRVSNELIAGLEIFLADEGENEEYSDLLNNLETLKTELTNSLKSFANDVLSSERSIIREPDNEKAAEYLMNFLTSFASRSATRERLNIFTTNYDRVLEYGSELAGIRLIDRFVGSINPIFRSSRVNVDMHYNPPGIRGEPRYLEGVVQFSKLHGSLDWVSGGDIVKRIALPYGAEDINQYLDGAENILIYPNSAKDRETSEYPYVELFRDFAATVCRPNSTIVVYGYSFGDDHINRIISDMLTIPSTHLVIISFDDKGGRIERFYKKVKRPAQISILIGSHFGDLGNLVDHYLPKPAIDRTTIRMTELLKSRGMLGPVQGNDDGEQV